MSLISGGKVEKGEGRERERKREREGWRMKIAKKERKEGRDTRTRSIGNESFNSLSARVDFHTASSRRHSLARANDRGRALKLSARRR